MFGGDLLDAVVVDPLRFPIHFVADEVIQSAREVETGTVREMTAVRQPHRQHRVAGFQQREVGRHVRLCPAVGLNVGMFSGKQILCSLDCQ